MASRLRGNYTPRPKGPELIAAGFAADVAFCARLDVSTTVPVLHRDGDGLVLRALS